MAGQPHRLENWAVGWRKRSCWVQIWAGLHFSFIFVWIKGALHRLGSQEKHVAPCPVGLFALDSSRMQSPCQPVRDGIRTLTVALSPLLNHSHLFQTGSKLSSLRCGISFFFFFKFVLIFFCPKNID